MKRSYHGSVSDRNALRSPKKLTSVVLRFEVDPVADPHAEQNFQPIKPSELHIDLEPKLMHLVLLWPLEASPSRAHSDARAFDTRGKGQTLSVA